MNKSVQTIPLPPPPPIDRYTPIEVSKKPFTWLDAVKSYPITIPFFAPFYVMNGLSGGNGLGYQKFVPQFYIDHNKRVHVPTKTCFDSWNH